MKSFLNADMEKYQNINRQDSIELKQAFKNAVIIIKSLFDKHAFKDFIKVLTKILMVIGNQRNLMPLFMTF